MKRLLRAPGDAEAFTEDRLPAGQQDWFHVYCTAFQPAMQARSFNRGWGQSRFAPLADEHGKPLGTYYLASTVEAALMESVLHDISLHPPGSFELAQLPHYRLVHIKLTRALRFVNLHTPYLPKLGITRAQLVDSSPRHYPETREWAQAVWRQCPQAQALGYGSRRDDSARCLMLFEDRIPATLLEVLSDECLAFGKQRQAVRDLMRRLGVTAL